MEYEFNENEKRGQVGKLRSLGMALSDKTSTDRRSVPATYKGVSYNPLLCQYGERFDMLDFFSWGKAVRDRVPEFNFLIMDATAYWVVNAVQEPLSKKPLNPIRGFMPAAEEAVETLRKRLSSSVGVMVRKSSEIRNRYLRAMASLFPNGAVQVLTAKDLWFENKTYLEQLKESIKFCSSPLSTLRFGPVSLKKTAKYSRYNEDYQKWYTPLVLAEALYLKRAYGAGAKLGPTSETAFDKLILDLMKLKFGPQDYSTSAMTGPVPMGKAESDYQIFWYTRPLDGKLRYDEYVFFDDSNDSVRKKMKANPELAAWLAEISAPFFPEGNRDEAVDMVVGLKEKIQKISRNPPDIPNTPGDWWFKWPPGSCG